MQALICNQCVKVATVPETERYLTVTQGPVGGPILWHFCGYECLGVWASRMQSASVQFQPTPAT